MSGFSGKGEKSRGLRSNSKGKECALCNLLQKVVKQSGSEKCVVIISCKVHAVFIFLTGDSSMQQKKRY